jgi:hypothetical protein
LVLAGLPPPVVIDIASRALSFWNYQQDHEKMYQTVLANHAEKVSFGFFWRCLQFELENDYHSLICYAQRVAVLEKELTESKRKNEADAECKTPDFALPFFDKADLFSLYVADWRGQVASKASHPNSITAV